MTAPAARLRVSIRVGGETKLPPTYHQLLEDLSLGGLGGGRIVEGGFAGYRVVPLAVTVPLRAVREAGEAAGDDLLAQLASGLGVNPRMLSGRLVAVVEAPQGLESLQSAASALRAKGYSAEPSGASEESEAR